MLLAVVFLLCCLYTCEGSEREVFLHIFEKYDKRIRPVLNTSTTTVVGIQPQIISLLEVNSQQEYIKLAMFFKVIWHDEFLTWNPADFGDTQYIRAPVSLLWAPDLSVVTASLKSEDFIPKEEQVLGIHYSGAVDYSFPFFLTNYCPMQNDDFPFDSQTCIVKVSSWKYTSNFISLEHVFMNNTGARNPSTVWEIQPYTNKSADFAREGAGEDGVYRQVHYYVTLKRKSTYYIWVIIFPTFIITGLCIAGVFAPFSNNGERQEKSTLGLTTLLTLAIILSLVTAAMPKGTKLPLLGLYILTELIICTLSVAVSVMILFLHQRSITRDWQIPSLLFELACFGQRKKASFGLRSYDTQKGDAIEQNTDTDRVPETSCVVSFRDKMNTTLFDIRRWLQQRDDEENRKNQWLLVFDRIDLLCFIVFEVLNVICFAIIAL